MIEAPASALLERYQLLRKLGQGGYGSVYEALDRGSGQRVALKELIAVNSLAVAHFKQEFRAMQEVHHPNLVRLDTLFEDRGKWVIAMELVEGTDLLSYLYVDSFTCCFEEQQVRAVFLQLCDALQAVHAAGFVHRDLKPHNVRVTPEGRLVLLDFGLATSIDPDTQSTRLNGLGTLAYMAPEQADQRKVGPAADWYAFGVCLYQALTGVLPIDGPHALAALLAKQETPAPRASTHAANIPADLDLLCDALLQIAPNNRPNGRAVRGVLEGGPLLTPSMGALAPSLKPVVHAFEGREQELLALERALQATRAGKPGVVLVEGDSGIGKSALVDHFIGRPHPALVLRSRCYESELLAYKAFDGAMAELATYLCRLPSAQCEGLIPSQRAALLCRLFPALEAVDAIAHAPLLGVAADLALQRFEAFSVFTRLLTNLGQQQPMILVIDDLQWADAESFALLQSLLSTATTACLIVATLRPRKELEGDVGSALDELRKLPCVTTLGLTGLPKASATSLARRLAAPAVPDAWIDMIVTESAGHPLFLAHLARFAETHDPSVHVELTLDLAISAQLGGLARKARRLLDLIAVAGAPLPAGLCGRAAGLDERELGLLTTELCRQKWLRRRKAGQIGCFHDRIRRVAVACLPALDVKTLHGKLASALAEYGQVDPAELARHHEAAGDLALAREAYQRGAERALSGLAFARAALLYGRALDLSAGLGLSAAADHALRVARGHALARGGRSAEAARQYLRAAQTAQGADKTQLRVWAAQHLLQSACVEEGMAAAHELLAELGVPVPAGVSSMLARIAWDRTCLRLRGLDVASDKQALGTHQRMQLDALWGLALPVSWLDPLKAAALTTRHLRLARSWREPAHMARALAEEAFARQLSDPHDSAVDRLLLRARALASGVDEPALDVGVAFREGTIAALRGDMTRALSHLEHCHRIVTERCPDQPWLLTNVRVAIGPIWSALGEHAKLATSTASWLAEARDRNDQFALSLIEGVGSGYLRHLMLDDPELARQTLRSVLAPWPLEPFGFAHWGDALATSQCLLYRGGDAAHRWLERERPRFSKTLMLKLRFGKAALLNWQGGACIAASHQQSATDMKRLRDSARSLSKELEQIGLRLADLNAQALLAQLDALAGDVDSAQRHLAQALQSAVQGGNVALQNALHYLQGVLEAGEAGASRRQAALAFFADQGWKEPRRALAMLCPGLDGLEGLEAA